jgi:hypothetical protein
LVIPIGTGPTVDGPEPASLSRNRVPDEDPDDDEEAKLTLSNPELSSLPEDEPLPIIGFASFFFCFGPFGQGEKKKKK